MVAGPGRGAEPPPTGGGGWSWPGSGGGAPSTGGGGWSLARIGGRSPLQHSHRREVIHHREIEVLGLELEGDLVVDAEAAHLQQEVARVAAAERAAGSLVMGLDQIVDGRSVGALRSLASRPATAIILRKPSSVGLVASILYGIRRRNASSTSWRGSRFVEKMIS